MKVRRMLIYVLDFQCFLFFVERNFLKVKDRSWNYTHWIKQMNILNNPFIRHFYRTDIHFLFLTLIFLCCIRIYKQCVESSITQFKSGLNNRPALGLLQAFLHTEPELNDQQTKNSSINQTFFSQ